MKNSGVRKSILANNSRFSCLRLPRGSGDRFLLANTATTVVFEIDGVESSDSSVVTNAFNDHFQPVFTKEKEVLETLDVANPPLPDIVISEERILNLLLKLDVKKIFGSKLSAE